MGLFKNSRSATLGRVTLRNMQQLSIAKVETSGACLQREFDKSEKTVLLPSLRLSDVLASTGT